MSTLARRVAGGASIAVLLIAIADGVAREQGGDRTVWDGVVTQAQARRGEMLYSTACAACHGVDLAGGQSDAGALTGDRFMHEWSHDTLQSLFTFVRTLMPLNKGGSLRDDEYLDVRRYLLQQNGFPAGAADLTLAPLAAIRIQGRDGPGPLPNFAVIDVVGCLVRQADGVWMLTGAGEPVRTRQTNPVSEAAVREAAAQPAGANRFQLQGVSEDLGRYQDNRIMLRGILIRNPAGDRVNVNSLRVVSLRRAGPEG